MENKTVNNQIKILAFGIVAEIINSTSFTIDNILDTNELKLSLEKNYPNLKDIKFSIAVNKKIIHSNTALSDGFEVALLPPFSGG